MGTCKYVCMYVCRCLFLFSASFIFLLVDHVGIAINHSRKAHRSCDRIVQKLGHGTVTWDRCYDSLNIFAEKFGDQIGVFLFKTKLNYVCKKLIITLVFEKNNNFFDDNCNHNIKTNMATLALTSFVEINVPM
jgi:hypothetical protein